MSSFFQENTQTIKKLQHEKQKSMTGTMRFVVAIRAKGVCTRRLDVRTRLSPNNNRLRLLPGNYHHPMRTLWSLSSLTHPRNNNSVSLPMMKHDAVFPIPSFSMAHRCFETEAAYHPVADITLETIQDAVEQVLEEQTNNDTAFEINLAAGVLTLTLPPHGTWVLNKQTPNRQIWWSSPLSGPKRFEYDHEDKLWFATKDGLNLGREMVQEIRHFYPNVPDFEIHV